ncbi:YdeI/OmpD-associated family protein [Emticicia sp.]|uniref:YdeI/OmpD-associated family protein n=1 Tax=Emticicia sp. TaxID=1930953 RepID=UPI0037532772
MKIEYEAIILKNEEHSAVYCEIPFNVFENFGKKRLKIRATFDEVEYRGLLTPMGGEYGLFMNKAIREKVGKTFGEIVHISIEEDTEPRTVEIPDDLLLAMLESDVKPFFDSLSFTHQKEYLQWILDAKKEKTRQNRLIKAIEMMQNKIKTR